MYIFVNADLFNFIKFFNHFFLGPPLATTSTVEPATSSARTTVLPIAASVICQKPNEGKARFIFKKKKRSIEPER